MKKIFLALILIIAGLVIINGCSQPPEDIPEASITTDEEKQTEKEESKDIDMKDEDSQEMEPMSNTAASSEFEFEGYAIGKSHIGTFDDYSIELETDENNEIIGFILSINADSVNTGISKLDDHLRNEDFFDVENYPTITADTIELTDTTAKVMLDFHGITNEVEFPITRTDNSIEAEFLLDTTPHKIKYTGVNKDVRIKFKFTS